MSYYFNDGRGNTYGDKQYTRTTKQIKEVYRYKTLLTNDAGANQANYPMFYIKDGSVPWFDAHWLGEITSYDTQYIPVMSFAISSISGKYYLSDLPADPDTTIYNPAYFIPYSTAPFIYKADLYMGYKPIISMVDKTKGGKISWRTSESNMKYYNFTYKSGPKNSYYMYRKTGPQGRFTEYYIGNKQSYDNTWSDTYRSEDEIDIIGLNALSELMRAAASVIPMSAALGNDFEYNTMNLNVNYTASNFNTSNFIKKYPEDTEPLHTGKANFIKTTPYYDADSKFMCGSSFNVDGIAPPHITFKISDLDGYSKLKIKMDGIYIHANNNYEDTCQTNTAIDDTFVNNNASFGENATNPYCQALFYAFDNNNTWHIDNTASNYINDGHVFSNLEYKNGKLVPKNTNDYTITHTAYNDSYTDEIQNLNNKRLWDNMIPIDVADNYHIWTTATEIVSACSGSGEYYTTSMDPSQPKVHSQVCPYCLSGNNPDSTMIDGYFYLKCNEEYYETFKNDLEDIKIPMYIRVTDTVPYGYYPAKAEFDAQRSLRTYGAVCNGTMTAYKMSANSAADLWVYDPGYEGSTDWRHKRYKPGYRNDRPKRFPISTTPGVTCPACGGNYNGYRECFCYFKHDSNYTITLPRNQHPEPGIGVCRTCGGTGRYKPYKENDVAYRFKFYGKTGSTTLKPFEGFIRKSYIGGIDRSVYYSAVPASLTSNWRENAPQLLAQAQAISSNCKGVYYYENSQESDFTNYKDIIRPGRYLTASPNYTSISSSWIVCTPTGTRYCNRYYQYGNSYDEIENDYGVSNGLSLDKSWSKYTNKDEYGNDFQIDFPFKQLGMSPTAGTNHTISNVVLNYDIPLDSSLGNYLHIAAPCVTNFHSSQSYWCGNITQMIVTWEAE